MADVPASVGSWRTPGGETAAGRRPDGLVFVALGAVVVGAVVLQVPDFSRFHAAPVLLVCAGTLALALAAAMLAVEPGQRPNAVLFGVAAALFALEWAFTWPATPLPFVALPFGQLFALVLAVVLLRYPNSRLTRPAERWFVWCAALVTVVGRFLVEVFSRADWFAFGLSAGNGQLPSTTLWLTLDADHGRSHVAAVATDLIQLLVLPVFLVLILRRLRRESRPLRSELWPVVLSVFVLGGVLVTHLVALLLSAYRPASAPNEWISAVLSLSVMLIPLAFIFVTARARLTRAAVADFILQLNEPMTSNQVQDALRSTVRDDTLQVHYWLAQSQQFVDTTGQVVAAAEPGRMTREVSNRDGGLLAVVSADPALRRHPTTLNAAVAAVSMALENTRLEAELRAGLLEVRASRTRIAEAALGERRRIERDLHDGVQQQLIALGATLGRLNLRSDRVPADAELIDQARAQLRQTRRELRDLARGVHPAVLAESGLRAALSTVVLGLPVDAHVTVPEHRWPRDVELSAYLVACEALTNCVKHARASQVQVVVLDDDDRIVVRIADDGSGGARITPGGGLAGLLDRARALGGDLRLDSSPGHGTTVEVTLPCG